MHIDWWTLALQTVNVLILIWILGRFFFRPVADLVTKRRDEATRLLSDADAARKEADGVLGELSSRDASSARVHDSYKDFRARVSAWSRVSIEAVLRSRG